MNFKKTCFFVLILVLIVAIGAVSATDELNDTFTQDSTIENEISLNSLDDSNEIISQENIYDNLNEHETEEIISDNSDDIIVVNNWEELQYYCAQTDKDYTLALDEMHDGKHFKKEVKLTEDFTVELDIYEDTVEMAYSYHGE